MARETKAQREARENAEWQAQRAVMAATYPKRLMAVLERATKANFNLDVVNLQFVLVDRDERYPNHHELSLDYNTVNENALENLSWEVEFKEGEERKRQEKFMLRQQALAKLTKEEREELGL